MSPIELTCPGCQRVLRVRGVTANDRVRCPRCGDVFAPPVLADEIPTATPATAPIAEPPANCNAQRPAAPAAEPVPVASTQAELPVAAVAEDTPATPATPTASEPTDDDIFAKIAEADDPVAAAAEVRKPKPIPTPSEPEEDPPAKSGDTSRREARNEPKPDKKKRRKTKRDEEPVAGAINPFVLMGGLGLLAVAVLVLGGFFVLRHLNRQADAAVEAAERERAHAQRDLEIAQRERDAAKKRQANTEPAPNNPEPAQPGGPGALKPGGLEPAQPDFPPFDPPGMPGPPNPPVFPPGNPGFPFNPPGFPANPQMPPGFPVNPPGFPGNPPGFPGNPQMPGRPKVAFPAVEPVVIKPAPLAQDKVELKLPGTVTDTCVGGGGRYWCLLMADEKQIAVFDVNEAKITKVVAVDGGKMRIAANMNKLIVAYPDTGTLVRYDLATLDKEATGRSPLGRFDSVLMGSASAGPLYIDRFTVDPQTFQLYDAMVTALAIGRIGLHVRVSPDGHVIGSWSTAIAASGLVVSTVGDTPVKPFRERVSVGFVLPAADNTVVTGAGVYGPNGQKLAGPAGYFFRMPATEGGFYLTIPGGGGAQANAGKNGIGKPTVVYSTGDARAIVTLPDVALPASDEARATTDFLADKKVLFTTTGKLIAVLDSTGKKLTLHRFDLGDALDKAGIDYLFVENRPPKAQAGKPYKYAMAVKSKQGGLVYKLDAGPDGMKMAADGTVTWDVPKDWAGAENVIVTIADKTGREILYTFALGTPPAPNPGVGFPQFPQPGMPPDAAGPKGDIVLPAANPARLTPTKSADKAEIKLPGIVDATCTGGNGRFVFLRIPTQKQVAVLDVCEGKVTKSIPIPEDNALVAAGNEHLFVLSPNANVIQKWDLKTFQKEITVANPLIGTPRQILIGHATDGPLFVVGPNVALNTKSFKEIPIGGGVGNMAGFAQFPPTVSLSADGRVFAWTTPGFAPSGLSSLVIGPNGAKNYSQPISIGAIVAGPDGTLFTAGGLFTPELKSLGGRKPFLQTDPPPIPAAHGKLYLSITPNDRPRPEPRATLKLVGENKELADLTDLAGLDIPKNHNQMLANGLQLHDRVFIVPDAKAIAILHGSADKVTIHSFDAEELLDKAGIDFLFVVGKAPTAVCGMLYEYKPEVKSRQGGVKIKLIAGPAAMEVSPDGILTWKVPPNFADTSVDVSLTITDKSGRETPHTFKLLVSSR